MPAEVPVTHHQRSMLRIVVMAGSIAIAGCASMQVGSYLERNADLGRLQSYAWDDAEPGPTGDARLDNNEIFQARVESSVDEQLQRHGLRQVAANPDVLVHYHVSVTQKVDVRTIDRDYGYCPDCEPFVYDAGTLFIDLVDPRSKRIVWRGWAESAVDGVIDDQEWLNERVDEAVARILQRLPIRQKLPMPNSRNPS
jgi:Domain of unknown function (DUF4136)